MLTIIDNPKRNEYLTKFNAKIEAYNDAIQNQDMVQALQLLQELYFFQQYLHNLAMDSLFDPQLVRGNLSAIFDWSGIQEELTQWTSSKSAPLSGLSTEKLLNDLTSRSIASDTINDWRTQIEPSLLDAISFLWGGGQNQQVVDNIRQLLALYDAPDAKGLNYFYGLQQIKTQMIHDINFGALSAADLVQYRALLIQISGQINHVIANNPTLNSRYESHATQALDVRGDFQRATAEDKEAIFPILHASIDYTKIPDSVNFPEKTTEEMADFVEQIHTLQQTVHRILPHLSDRYVHRLAGSNNKTWLLQQDQTAERTVLRVEQPVHATLVHRLRETPVNEFFAQTYATYAVESNAYLFVISEFAEKGDVRSHRSQQAEFSNDDAVIQQAINDLGQMANFCHTMLMQGAMHSDIKLSNFLLNGQRQILVNDMKAFKPISPEGKIHAQGTVVTPPFAPPEYYAARKAYSSAGSRMDLDADKFMSYQLGLALYDYLVLPENTDEELMWSQKPLDFSHAIFSTPIGKQLQTLIEKSTDPNPETRVSTQYTVKKLEALQNQAVKLHMTLNVTERPVGSKEAEIEADPIVEVETVRANTVVSVQTHSEEKNEIDEDKPSPGR